jgi:hypothetical protein
MYTTEELFFDKKQVSWQLILDKCVKSLAAVCKEIRTLSKNRSFHQFILIICLSAYRRTRGIRTRGAEEPLTKKPKI